MSDFSLQGLNIFICDSKWTRLFLAFKAHGSVKVKLAADVSVRPTGMRYTVE